MPELPEVETVRRDLDSAAKGRRFVEATVTGRRTIRRQEKDEFIRDLRGRTVIGTRRRGKYLLVDLDDDSVLVVHLRMSGQLLHVEKGATRALHTHVVLGLDDESEIHFVDPRTFGELFVTDDLDDRRVPVVLAKIGIDPVTDGVSFRQLAEIVRRRKMPLKALLLDQSAIAGIGNIYADEICFAARLRPNRRTDTLSGRDIGRLCRSIGTILEDAIAARGSTLIDARYRDLYGVGGRFQERHAVYARTGASCLRCGTPVEKTQIGGRSAHFCPHCQH